MKNLNKKLNLIRKKDKTYSGDYWNVNSIFGNDWAMFFVLLGGREAGKSYSVMEWGVKRKIKLKDNLKFYWFRLTDAAVDSLLAGGASKLIDPDLKKKFNIKTFRKGSTIFSYNEKIENEKKIKENINEFCEVLSCSTFYNTKGKGYFDNSFQGEYLIVLDEMNREESERNNFDIVYNFVNLIENVARSTKKKIKIIMIGNTLEEASDLLAAFNFIPDEFGRYKLKRRRCVVDYIKPNEKYLARRKGTAADLLAPQASTFTNEVKIDRSLLVNKRERIKPLYVVKFKKTKDAWFTIWNDRIVSDFNNEERPVIAMRRYLDEEFNLSKVNSIIEIFDSRAFKFVNLACFKKFQKQLKLLKK